MTVLNFPASPALNATYTENNVTYTWNGSYWDANNTGSLDNIYVEVAGDSMTGNLQLPGGGGNTAALQKQEITDLPVSTFDNDRGYITSSDIPPGTVSYWNKDGDTLEPVTDTDNVNIGDGSITLNAADGSITAAGSAFFGDFPTGNYVQTNKGGVVEVRRDGSSSNDVAIQVYSDGTTPTDRKFSVAADGSVIATGEIAYVNPSPNGKANIFGIYNSGNGAKTSPTLQMDSNGNIRLGGVLPSAPAISLNADGSINAAGDNFKVQSSGQVRVLRDTSVGSGNPKDYMLLMGWKNTYADNNQAFHISAGGTAQFAGDVGIGGTYSGGLISDPAIELNATTGVGSFSGDVETDTALVARPVNANDTALLIGQSGVSTNLVARSSGDVLIGGTLPAAPATSLNADGSANFNSGTSDKPTIYAYKNNSNALYPPIFAEQGNPNGSVFSGKNSFTGQITSNILANGAAVFSDIGNGVVVGDKGGTKGYCQIYGAGSVVAQRPLADINQSVFTGGVQGAGSSTFTVDAAGNLFCDASVKVGGTQVPDAPNVRLLKNGTIQAVNTTIQPISSERRLKENIVAIDADTAWETIKSTPYYTYNFIGSESTTYGPMADEVPAEMVVQPMVKDEEGNQVARADAEGPIRTYDNGMLQARLYTALQTALTRIEALEARLDTAGV